MAAVDEANKGTRSNKNATPYEKEERKKPIVHRFISFYKKRLARHWLDLLVLAAVAGCAGGVHWGWDPYNSFFVERDPTHSYPYEDEEHQEVTIPQVIVLAIIVPMILGVILQSFFRFCSNTEYIHKKAVDPFLGLLVFLEAFAANALFTEFLKAYVGRLRPNFYAMCNYKGYRTAMETGNFTEYFNLTVEGRPGTMDDCWDRDPWILTQVKSSFPSGHASFAFSGWLVLTLLMVFVWHCYTRRFKALKALLVFCGFIIALLLSWNRSRDYWHFWDDVFAGAVIGGVIGACAFFLNYSLGSVDKTRKVIDKQQGKPVPNDDDALEKGSLSHREETGRGSRTSIKRV